MFGVETDSFLPDEQSDRRDLACQRQAGHGRLHPFGQQRAIEIVKRTRGVARLGSGTFEDAFQIMIVILVKTAQRRRLPGSLQLTSDVVVFPAAMRFQSQAAVCPQLPFSAKPMRRLHQRDQQRGPNRANIRDSLQQVRRAMPAALR